MLCSYFYQKVPKIGCSSVGSHYSGGEKKEKHPRRQVFIVVKLVMFTGSTKQRKVDYSGGKKRDTERKDFLLKQARLREDRAAER